jgi:hypothetical protein
MDIHFVSSLAEEDEVRLADTLLGVLTIVLQHYPIAYSVRVKTSGGTVVQHHHGLDRPARVEPASGVAAV